MEAILGKRFEIQHMTVVGSGRRDPFPKNLIAYNSQMCEL